MSSQEETDTLSAERLPTIVAHRGASRDAPENTLAAFNLAWEQGADAIECDVHLTKDGQIAVIHDANTERVAGTKLVVAHSTLEELQALNVAAFRDDACAPCKVPALRDVLATVPSGKHIYIEIKSGPDLVPILLEQLEASDIDREHVVVISFNAATLHACKRLAPTLKTFLLVQLQLDAAGTPRPSMMTLLESLLMTKADALSVGGSVPEAYVVELAAKGYEWHTWTLDTVAEARQAIRAGAESVTTNIPALMKGELK
ncbi:MAG: glycerophosphodiester phosphodiesterase [Verrucomicrobia bacterium]|nr:glycerophosphodiester phosphodiesterase [Verrucomicrobiota bacterium]MBT7066219.1 glycerophosphodiester phosphodiesterase [Verrucomicrobiota bacterium]MBT7699696.1 glycerophosphodiester phosphodiesterase [Verrucomicrobiota bacterium]